MAKRYFNWKLAIVLVIGLAVLGTTAVVLRKWQRSHRAELGLAAGNKAYDEQRWVEAARNLGRYLIVDRENVPILLKYADAQLKIRPAKPSNIQQAINTYRSILRIDRSNFEAAKKLSEIYIVLGMPGEAELIARKQLEGDAAAQKEEQIGTQADKNPELRKLLALALAGQRKYSEAAAELKAIIQEHPEQILAYETLAQLTEQRPRDFVEPAAHWYDLSVKNNPSSALAYIIRAGFYLRNNDRAKVLADLEQAEKLDISDTNVQLRLARGFINAGVLDKAEEYLVAMQEATPTELNLWQTWVLLALKSQSKEKMVSVAENGLKNLSSQPWDFLPMAAELLIRAGQFDRASDCISKLRQQGIFPETVAFFEGLIAEQKGQYFDAVKHWQRSIESGNRSPQVRLALSAVLSRLGNRQSAAQQLRSLISERPNFLEGRLALIRLLAQTGNWAEVMDHATTAMRLSPDNTEAVLAYLQARVQLAAAGSNRSEKENLQIWQDIEEQLEAVEKAAEGVIDVKLLQFQVALQQSNFTKAEELIKDLKIDYPSQVKVALAEADMLTAQKKEHEAISVLNKAMEEFPGAVEPVLYLVMLYNREGAHKEIESTIKKALERINRHIVQRDLCLQLADLYTQWGQKDNAYQLLSEFVQKIPGDILIKRRLLGCEQVSKNSQQAQQLINNIKSLEGENGWQWRYEQAKAWFVGDNFTKYYPQIVSLLHENLLANPDDQTSRMLLASAYERSGELKLAISTYREALDRSPDDIRIIIPTITALSKAKEYAQVDEVLNRIQSRELRHPQLQTLQLQSHLRHGQLGSASEVLQDIITYDPNNEAARFSLALVNMQLNNFAEAEKLLSEIKAQEPNSLSITYAQVQLKIRQGKSEEALRLCDDMVNNLSNAYAYILRARTHITFGQIDKAAKDFEQSVIIEPNNVDVWIARSEFYRTIGQPDLALADIQHALSLEPDNLIIQKRTIPLLLASNNSEKIQQGTTILENALKSNPDDIQLRLFKARLLMLEGTTITIRDAQQILERITEDRPETADAWVLLGEIALAQKQHAKAIDAALRGLVYSPNNKILFSLKARGEAARSPALAIATLRVLYDIYPNDVDTNLQLANTYIAAGQAENAAKLLEKQLTISKDTDEQRRLNMALAVAQYRSGNKTQAQEIFDALFQSEPNDPGPLMAQVQLLSDDKLWNQLKRMIAQWRQNHPEDINTSIIVANTLASINDSDAHQVAEDLLRSVLEQAPRNLPAMNTLAMLLQMTEHFEEAARLYQEILELQPDNVVVMNNLAWIMCEEQGKYREALKITQRGLQIAPNYIDLIDTRGVIYHRLGEFDKAIESYNESITLYPKENPSVVASYFHLGRSLAAQKKKDKAIDELKRALDLHNQIGGLSKVDINEAQNLLEQLQKGS
jgi:tetratricopeptide (TPR) repeat protein